MQFDGYSDMGKKKSTKIPVDLTGLSSSFLKLVQESVNALEAGIGEATHHINQFKSDMETRKNARKENLR
jgi:hypothetical protein